MNVFFDIETIPAQPEAETIATIAKTIQAPAAMSKQETIDAWHAGEGKYAGEKAALIEETYRKTALDGGKGQIISLAWAIEDRPVNCMHRNLGDSEAALLSDFFAQLKRQSAMKPPYFVGHNVGGFDLKFLYHRAVILGVNPGFDMCQWGRHGSNFFDTMLAWAGYGGRISLDNLCTALGMPGKPDDIDGSKVWDFVKAGNVARVAEYNQDDVERVRTIYRRMKFTDQQHQQAA